jgi:hypothetical protein
MAFLLLILVILSMATSVPAATSMKYSTSNLYSHTHHQYLHSRTHRLYDHMATELTSLQPQPQPHSPSEEAEFVLSSVDAYDKRDLDALLSFRNAITRDPYGLLSNWTAENSEKMCSWYGIRCILHTTRVVSIDLTFDLLEGTLSPSLGNLSLLNTLNIMIYMAQFLSGSQISPP